MNSTDMREKFFEEHPDIYSHYLEIKNTNARKEGNLTNAFEAIKKYAIEHSRFYAEHPNFPVMTKMDYIENFDSIISDEIFDRPIHISSTSGSTGIPFSVEQDYNKRMRNIADLKVFGEYANYMSHEKMLQLRAYHGKFLDRSIDEKENIWRFDISDLSDRNIEEFFNFINEWRPRIIFGYTSTLDVLCDYAEAHNKCIPDSVVSILVGAETLTDCIANKITKVFDCPLYDRYSNMEMGIYAQREYGKTNFRVNNASYYLEVLKLDMDEPADVGEVGRIVFTDLYNHRFPMIRYDTGDVGIYCFNGKEIELKEVYGRMRDCVYDTKGNMLSPGKISVTMWGEPGVKQWQFIQKSQNDYIIYLNLQSGKGIDCILNNYKNILGHDANIIIELVDEIPVLSSSKRRSVICEWKKER